MPAGQHDNPAEEPSSAPSQPDEPATVHVRFMPGATRAPGSQARIEPQVMLIGRNPRNDIIVSDLGVSKHHAELRRSPDGRHSIIDLGSHNGTYVNGTRISWHEPTELHEGDIIKIGHATLRLTNGELTEHAADDRPPG